MLTLTKIIWYILHAKFIIFPNMMTLFPHIITKGLSEEQHICLFFPEDKLAKIDNLN